MTKQAFLDQFFIEYDKVATLGAPGYTAAELSIIASEAQEALVIEKYGPNSNRLKEGFEESEKRTQELGELMVYASLTPTGPGFLDNSYTYTLPNTLLTTLPKGTDFSNVFWFTVFEEVLTNVIDCTIPGNTTKVVTAYVVEVTHDQYNLAVDNPFRKPYVKGNTGRVFRLRTSGFTHELVTDGTFGLQNYKIGYIKKPLPIDLTQNLTDQVSQLADSFHRELLHRTVEIAKADVQDPSLQVNLNTLKE